MKPKRLSPGKAGALAAPLLLLIAAVLWPGSPADRTTPAVSASPKAPVVVPPEVAARGEAPVLRPLPVAHGSETHEWTDGDATATEVIEKIAHNPEEFIRLVEENDRIQRRQLVYRKTPAWELVQQSRGAEQPIRTLVLPGLDGREIEVEVTGSDLSFSGLSGTFTGRVAGKPQSLVTLAFDRGREAFTVLSPEDGIYLQGHPREPGEIIVTRFLPDTYQPLGVCQPILTAK